MCILFRQNSKGRKGTALNNAASWVYWVGLRSPDYVSCSGMSCYAPSFPRQLDRDDDRNGTAIAIVAPLMPRNRKGVKSRIDKSQSRTFGCRGATCSGPLNLDVKGVQRESARQMRVGRGALTVAHFARPSDSTNPGSVPMSSRSDGPLAAGLAERDFKEDGNEVSRLGRGQSRGEVLGDQRLAGAGQPVDLAAEERVLRLLGAAEGQARSGLRGDQAGVDPTAPVADDVLDVVRGDVPVRVEDVGQQRGRVGELRGRQVRATTSSKGDGAPRGCVFRVERRSRSGRIADTTR